MFHVLTFLSSVSSGVIIGTLDLTVIGLVAALALLLFVIGSIYLVARVRRVRIRVTIKQIRE